MLGHLQVTHHVVFPDFICFVFIVNGYHLEGTQLGTDLLDHDLAIGFTNLGCHLPPFAIGGVGDRYLGWQFHARLGKRFLQGISKRAVF